MNCQEVQSLIEDALDRRLAGGAKRRFDLHLARCASCRDLLAAEQREHARWFHALNNEAAVPETLPPDFADRLASLVSVTPTRRPFLLRLPRWVRIAAALAILASLTAFGSWIAATLSVDSRILTESSGYTATLEETAMKPTLAATALAAGAALSSATLQAADANSCIISGSTARDCATAAYADAGDLDARSTTVGLGTPLDPFEARSQTRDFGDALAYFRTDEPRGYVIVFR